MGLGGSEAAKWAVNTISLETACRTSGLGHSSRYSLNLLGCEKRTLLANQARLVAEHLKCCESISYQSVAFPLSDFLVWKPTLKRKEEASWTVVRLMSSPSLDSFSPCPTVTKGALHWISFFMKLKYSRENWFLLCKNLTFCFKIDFLIGLGMASTP